MERVWILTVFALFFIQAEDSLNNHTILYQMVALYDYSAQGPEDLEFSEGDTIDILGEGTIQQVNISWAKVFWHKDIVFCVDIVPSRIDKKNKKQLMMTSHYKS